MYTSSMLKTQNKKAILDFIYKQKKTTSASIAISLDLSRPTITQILKELVAEHMIYQDGHAESTGGRKANKYIFNATVAIAIGVEIVADKYEITAIDMYGEMLKYEKFNHQYSEDDAYYDALCACVNRFIHNIPMDTKNIIGVGIALQSLISIDGKEIIYGKILNCTGLTIQKFSERIPYPCSFKHDAESLANVEIWMNKRIKNAIFFNIRKNLSGSIIIDGKFFKDGVLKSGVFEHLTMVPNGRSCYCGKKGCLNAYCSISALLSGDENTDVFFNLLRENDPQKLKQWNSYLDYLSIAIDNLHMVINSEVILGGTLAQYFTAEDMVQLRILIKNRTAFPEIEQKIKISTNSQVPLCMGAAIPYIREYLSQITE